jgi:ferredoxin
MTFFVDGACIRCKYQDCVSVCPVDCFKEGPNFLVIDPNECIDCGVCEPECPADAIKPDVRMTDEMKFWADLNRELSKTYKPIAEKGPAPNDADSWNPKLNPNIGDKRHLL